MEALQGSVETLKAEKVEIQNELNILKRESKSDENSTNNQMEMGLEKAEKDVDREKLGVQSESATLTVERTDCEGELGLTETKKNSMETEIENLAENSPLVDSAETSIDNIQLGFETSKAEQVDPFVDEGNRDKFLEREVPIEKVGHHTSEDEHEIGEREEEQKASDGETEQSSLLETLTPGLRVEKNSLLETLKVENASLLQVVESLSSEKAEMHQFHSQVGRHKANT